MTPALDRLIAPVDVSYDPLKATENQNMKSP